MPEIETGRPTFANINLDHLAFNFRSAKNFVGETVQIMAVVKADAYGHGAIACSRRLEREGVDWLGVALPEEGLELRYAGIAIPILCLGGFWPAQASLLVEKKITPVIFRLEMAEGLNAVAAARNETVPVHIKIDTGMGRIGVPAADAPEFAAALKRFTHLKVEGLMSHFAAADDPAESAFTKEQISKFEGSVGAFQKHGFAPGVIDLANSPGTVAFSNSHFGMVRLGGILYGLGGDVLPPGVPTPELRPVLSLHSAISQVKHVPAGQSLGYGRTFRTVRDSLIATVPIGYHDGYRRVFSNQSRVIVNGCFAPVVGRVSMDWTIVDVTDVTSAAVGDEVVLIGRNGDLEVRSEDLAAFANTISYEITCGISHRVPRRYSGAGDQ